jgi:hypothetical protein
LKLLETESGANPATFEFTASTQALEQARAFLHQQKIFLILKTRHAISCSVNFCNAGVVTQGRKLGSWIRSDTFDELSR